MQTFAQRLREEIEYSGLLQKELADKAGIKKRALDMYLGSQASIPPADVAVRLAKVLGVTVEYLVTGEGKEEFAKRRPFRRLEEDFAALPDDIAKSVEAMVHAIASHK
ncbi:MAG: helix-turn-helix domain-containing protein [Treponema sp.]|nr:helix-turn-helix domain-containing protein [Treponema sp.]